MKYVVLLSDGMAGRPLEELNGRTTLEAAATPVMDCLSEVSELGMASMVPEGMAPGSDTANLAVMGYDPKVYYTGRSPLEALSIGVDMEETDVSFRCNIVTLSEEDCDYEDRTIIDHSSDEISTEDAAILLEALREGLEREGYRFYAGTSYRHLLIWKNGNVVELTPPHDILAKRIGDYLPQNEVLRDMMKKSYDILENHPINVKRRSEGLHPANSAWFWGAGKKPALTSFEERTGKRGVMISAVDLLKGIAVENIDKKVLGIVVDGLRKAGEEFRLLLLPDHPTPIKVRTHTGEPVPYLLYDSTKEEAGPEAYNEKTAYATGRNWPDGYQLIGHLLQEDIC